MISSCFHYQTFINVWNKKTTQNLKFNYFRFKAKDLGFEVNAQSQVENVRAVRIREKNLVNFTRTDGYRNQLSPFAKDYMTNIL